MGGGLESVHQGWVRPPNGSRLSCGRLARRRKSSGRQSVLRQGHNTPIPLERSPPASFKRLLGSALTSSGADRARRELQPHFLTAADMAEPARPRSSASITGMNSKSAFSQRKRGSATAGIFEASSKFTTI